MTVKRILCASDFSKASRPALKVALGLARVMKSRLVLCHAYQVTASMLQNLIGPVRADAERRLGALSRSARASGVSVTTRLVEGASAAAIVRAAKKERAGLIVLGTHGRTGLTRMLIGSVAERVVRTAPCPVLTVPARKA